MLFVKRIFHEHRAVTSCAIDVIVGFYLGVAFKMDFGGIGSGSVPAVATGCAIIWLTSSFVLGVAWPTRERMIDARIILALGRSIRSLVTLLVVGFLAIEILPDPARIYLLLWRQYIQEHWMTDPHTGLFYFPLRYVSLNESETFPLTFYLWDKNRDFRMDPYGNPRLISPACPGAKYSAKSLGENIYFLRFYVDDPAEPASPCLTTPTLKHGNQP
jgi:hypothetical protein